MTTWSTTTIYAGPPYHAAARCGERRATEYFIPPLTPKQREYLRLIYLGGVEACPSEPGRCKVVDSLCRAGMLDKHGLSEIGRQVGRGIAEGVF